MKSIDEIYRDFPDEERERRAARVVPPAPACSRCALIGLLPLLLLLAGWIVVPLLLVHVRAVERAREREERLAKLDAQSYLLLQKVKGAIEGYQRRYGELPPWEGQRSGELLRCLARPGEDGRPLLEPGRVAVDREGNLRSPLGRPIHYRAPGIRNPRSFDLWTADRRGDPEALRNWE